MSRLAQLVEELRARIGRYRSTRKLNEENTKATLIEPVLRALGWNLEDLDEVNREFKVKRQDKPVDYALLLVRTPRLLIEAKALGEALDDRRWASQIMGYASVVGAEWVVLTNGDEYRVYNAHAAVSVDEKLFRTVRVSDPATRPEDTLALLDAGTLKENRLEILWKAYFVDKKVRDALSEIFTPTPDPALVRLVRQKTHNLSREEIRRSLARVVALFEFPVETEPSPAARSREAAKTQPDAPSVSGRSSRSVVTPADLDERGSESRKPHTTHSNTAAAKSAVSLKAIVTEGLLRPPVELSCRYLGHDLRATVEPDGVILFDGVRYTSPSVAGGMAKKPFFKGKFKRYPSTNGWAFWQVQDPTTRELIPLDKLRDRYLQGERLHAERFTKGRNMKGTRIGSDRSR